MTLHLPHHSFSEAAETGKRREGFSVWSIITSLTSGGAEVLVANLSRAFADKGVRNTVIPLCDAEELGYSRKMEAILKERITAGGADVHSLGLSRKRGNLEGARALRKALEQDRPDIIHCHTARVPPMVWLSGWRGPTVLTHHNSKLSFSRRLFFVFDKIVNAYVAISPETETIYRTYGSRQVVRIPNAAGLEYSASVSRSTLRTPATIISVGAISRQKNYPLLLETARILKGQLLPEDMPAFIVAGGGEDLAGLRSQVQNMGLSDHVSFLGERTDIAELLRSADLYLNTSLYEGQPVAMLEAFSAALPVIATNVAGNCELVGHRENGLLASVNSPEEIAGAIRSLLMDSVLYQSLSRGALAKSRCFSIEGCAQNHLALYQEITASRSISAQ
ncbi:MAG: glycosyltransferase family 4 protein, partial [Sphingomonadaceae bacterium]